MKRPLFALAPPYTEEEIEKAIDAVTKELPERIERILYTVGDDWADEPALFFRVLLKDPENRFDNLASRDVGAQHDFTGICHAIIRSLSTALRFEMYQPYFDFRTVPQQERLRSPEWE